MTPGEAALHYASWGWHVLPVVPGSKVPATRHGVHDATTNPETIARWWAANSDFNVGIAAGERSGIVVFDVDPRNGGDASWSNLVGECGGLDGAHALTAGGGEHHLAQWVPGIRSCKLRDGIDLLSDGRYFVAYPSAVEGKTYQWEASADPFAGIAPGRINARMLEVVHKRLSRASERATGAPGNGLISGNRNSGLTSLAGSMRRHGLTEAEILAALQIANETRCDIPLPSSEIQQIARSVSRYEPESDVAASVALGTEAAEAILAPLSEPPEYYLTRASAYLSQPAPIGWVVKHLIPADASTMLVGDSAMGKSFVLIDLVCSIASGMAWMGRKTRSGLAVLLVGEGHWGMRQRVAAWAKHHQVDQLDRLLISNKGIDIDSPAAAAQIIAAVRELEPSEPVVAIGIDTVNTHMSGNENDARDTRNMLLACSIVSRALSCSTVFVHHSGHATDSKSRARGSSAWKASLDASYVVSRDEDGTIEIKSTKMKDAEQPPDFYGRLQKVDLGWVDEDGEPLTGAVFVPVEGHEKRAESNRATGEVNSQAEFEDAWWWKEGVWKGAELLDGEPFVARAKLIDYLVEARKIKRGSASKSASASAEGRLVHKLLGVGKIRSTDDGWVISDPVWASSLLLRRKSDDHTSGENDRSEKFIRKSDRRTTDGQA